MIEIPKQLRKEIKGEKEEKKEKSITLESGAQIYNDTKYMCN